MEVQPTYDLLRARECNLYREWLRQPQHHRLMMDCDTTGIEPDIALVKYKTLVGGGLLKIVNTNRRWRSSKPGIHPRTD